MAVSEGDDEIATAFHAWRREDSTNPNVLSSDGVELHKGRQVYKSATLRVFGDRETGKVGRTEFRVGTYPRKEYEPGYDFDRPDRTWACNDEQIDRIRALLNGELAETGFYLRVDKDAQISELIAALADGQLDVSSVTGLIEALGAVPGVADELANGELARTLTGVVERRRHREGLAALRRAVENAASTEQDLQAILEHHWWVFGSRYVGAAARRKLTLVDQFDIPLIRADGALHIVELKKAYYPRLLIPHRSHNVLGPEVHLAVSQAQNYLASLDRQESVIRAEFGLECRRAFATVVIGHSMHCPGYSRADVSDALRVYNSHLSRIEVVTYEDVIAGAERTLDLTEGSYQSDS